MFKARLKNVKQKLNKEKLDAVFISSVSNVAYFSGYANFSQDESEAYIFVGDNFEYIITDGRYSEAIKRQVPHLKLFERGHKKSAAELFKRHKKEIRTLGIEEDNLTVSEFKSIKKHFKNIRHFNASSLRSIKTNDEIEKIKKACQLGDLAFEHILKKIQVGISEKKVAQELENFIRNKGAQTSFPAIVAFGQNSSIPHHQTSDKRLTIDDKLILLDCGVKVEDYCSDMTRTIFFGEVTQRHRKIYKTVLEAQKRTVDFINTAIKSRQKIKTKEVDRVAREYITSQGFPTIPHSLGHGVGLAIHEHPYLSPKGTDILKPGMVFSIEPGIYIPNFGGVRIEDLYVLEKDSLRQLTTSTKEIISL